MALKLPVVVAFICAVMMVNRSEGCLCHLVPNFSCPPPPDCCESGQYTFDECGCCLTCAKSELQPCGGPSNSAGKCAEGLSCLKTCTPCKTIGSNPEPCVLPFIYQGVQYEKCTAVDALEGGSVWCATKVYDLENNRTVIDGHWGDCDEGCPGARRECDDRRFSILTGKCINPAVPGAIPNWFGAPAYRLLDKTKDLFPAPACSFTRAKSRRQYENTCRCATGNDAYEIDEKGTVRGNCTGLDSDDSDELNPVWCFLENIRDANNPQSGCFDDTTWSPRDGRFWSSKACNGLPPLQLNEEALLSNNLGDAEPVIRAPLKLPFIKPELSDAKPKVPATTTTTTTSISTSTTSTAITSSTSGSAEELNVVTTATGEEEEVFNYDYSDLDVASEQEFSDKDDYPFLLEATTESDSRGKLQNESAQES